MTMNTKRKHGLNLKFDPLQLLTQGPAANLGPSLPTSTTDCGAGTPGCEKWPIALRTFSHQSFQLIFTG